MARSAADAAAILQVIAGEDPLDPTALSSPVPDYLAQLGGGLNGLVIGVDWKLAETNVDPIIVDSFRSTVAVLKSLNARIREVTLPPFDTLTGAMLPLISAEIAVAHEATFPRHADRYGPDLRRMLESAAALTAKDLVRSTYARGRFNGALRKLFDEIDLLLLPGAPATTPTWTELEAMKEDLATVMDRIARFTLPFNVSGSPTLSLPMGFTPAGLPLGAQLIGPNLGEVLLCRAGHAFQQVTDFHVRHPNLP
jgi:amidase